MASLGLARALGRHAERAMLRASDAPLSRGNAARLLVDGPETFASWLEQIERAERWIHLENYVLRNDRTGRLFRDALAERARAGVRVRVLYDWMGCWATPKRFWSPLRTAGADVRAFAPPSLRFPLDFMRRDHRKVLAVDGEYASVGGMCIGDEWAGDPDAGIPPWRDTGVEFRGPVAGVIDRAFARTWAAAGSALPDDEIPDPHGIPRHGDVTVRVVEGEPGRSRIYRLSQLVSVGVERRLWITDPYFVAPPAMNESLASAARDGVDVRILVPAYNNWPIIGGMSRAGYQYLLEAGVRLFEWEGPMIHAKTTVADGLWSRVGSTNLNLASLLGNWELDVVVLDRKFAADLEALFLRDLSSAVEVKLHDSAVSHSGRRFQREAFDVGLHGEPVSTNPMDLSSARSARQRARRGSRVGRVLGRLARAGSVLGRALLGQPVVGRSDSGWILALSVLLLLVAVLGFWAPRVLAWPIAFLAFWLSVASLFRALPHIGRRRPPGEKR
ncbi:MAG: cardiolipin synthase B [Gemmatimonadetes bacterium]|nr:cardiolipin synthase B [Gemmatimonadota bacterium]